MVKGQNLYHTLTSIKANTVNYHTQASLLRIYLILLHKSLADIQTVEGISYNLLKNKITIRKIARLCHDDHLIVTEKLISYLLMLCPRFRH